MEDYNVKCIICIIYADCLAVCSKEDVQVLKENFESFEQDVYIDGYTDNLKKYSTFCCRVSDQPFEVLNNQYRIPDNYYWNKDYASRIMGLDEYLTIEEIKQLHFFEYEDEHIHRIYNQEKSGEIYVYCSAKDLNLVSKKLKEYLLYREEPALKLDRKYLQELQKLELLSAIGSKYDADFLLIPIFD